MKKVETELGNVYNLGNSIAKGGEGEVYEISGISNNQICAKIYHERFRTKEKEDKLIYMCGHPPQNMHSDRFLLCWPISVLYSSGKFIGYLMHKAFSGSIIPYHLCLPKFPKDIESDWSKIFDRNTTNGQLNRIKLCINISAAVYLIHQTGKYALIDLKPQNILVTSDGKVSLIDLDSIQISEDNKILYKSPVSTPEYTPPEAKKLLKSNKPLPLAWDSFSIGVLIYEILCGIHPFASTTNSPFENITTISEKIENLLSPVIADHSKFRVIPPPHNFFNLLSENGKKMMRLIFSGDINTRPTIDFIGKTLSSELKFIADNAHVNQTKIELQNLRDENQRLNQKIISFSDNLESKERLLSDAKSEITRLQNDKKNNSTGLWITILIIALAILSVSFFVTYQSQEDKLNKLKQNNEAEMDQLISKSNNEISNLKNENLKLNNKITELSEQVPVIKILNIDFASSVNGVIKVDYGQTLYSYYCYFINPRIEYYGYKSGYFDIYVKIYEPNGNLSTTKDSPEGYTLVNQNRYIVQGKTSLYLMGYGYNTSGSWQAGSYKYEIWIYGKFIGGKTLYIY